MEKIKLPIKIMVLVKSEESGDIFFKFLVPGLVLMARDGVSGHTDPVLIYFTGLVCEAGTSNKSRDPSGTKNGS